MKSEFREKFEMNISYEPMSGCWLWTSRLMPNGYGRAPMGKRGREIYAHRLSWIMHYGEIPVGLQVDHRCHCRACVNPEHLRLATSSQNNTNRSITPHTLNGYRGVSWHSIGKKWLARAKLDGKEIYLGLFDSQEEAYAVYCKETIRLHGEFAYLGGKYIAGREQK